MDIRLYMLQRLSAMIMAPLILTHIGVMIYAVQGGLSAAEILGRTQGSVGWAAFYGLLVLAVSVHAAIGVRVIVAEWTGIRSAALGWIVFAGLTGMGLWSVWAVTA